MSSSSGLSATENAERDGRRAAVGAGVQPRRPTQRGHCLRAFEAQYNELRVAALPVVHDDQIVTTRRPLDVARAQIHSEAACRIK